MEKSVRLKVLRAMETLARAVNDEEVFEYWLMEGVADGDITGAEDEEDLEYYIKDAAFSELMDTFLNLMAAAKKSGGLYEDGIVSMPYKKARERYKNE